VSPAVANGLQLLILAAILAGHLAAVFDWLTRPADAAPPVRTAAFAWAGAAFALALLLAVLRWIAFDASDARGFLENGGQILLLESLGAVFLVQSGERLGLQAGARPIRPERRRWRRWPWRWLGLSLAGMYAWVLALAAFVPHTGGPQDLTSLLRMDKMNPWLELPFAIALLTIAPILEECFFRHYLPYRLAAWMAKGRPSAPWIGNAILVSTILFALAHPARIDPYWFKWTEIAVPGLILGATAWRHGLEASIALHWAFNVGLIGMAASFAKTLGL
jgi:membrane protease YdiL (CAAX protease family)